eukprot:TRINITY_DN19544_c0_g2_i1.p2 TRINITY_DN19544_c0_g2~~TRINITY_DN19544_c0_g2_i1.p2  ORF type:complete len:115 (+),score=34.43 TRINITY_DN19544_c0_g2_i1:97-441(+)
MSSGLSIDYYICFMDKLMWGGSNPKTLAKSISNMKIPSKICNKPITIGWHCEQCCVDRSFCFCNECFDKKLHAGHNFVSLASTSGVLSLIHISEPTRPLYISYAVFCLKKKKKK